MTWLSTLIGLVRYGIGAVTGGLVSLATPVIATLAASGGFFMGVFLYSTFDIAGHGKACRDAIAHATSQKNAAQRAAMDAERELREAEELASKSAMNTLANQPRSADGECRELSDSERRSISKIGGN